MRRLSDAPTWRPMLIMWVIGMASMIPIDVLLHTAWGTFCLLPYAALAVQTFMWRYARRPE